MTRTSTLFATPSFIGGLASILDMGTTLTNYNLSNSPEHADYKAIRSDWAAVGDNLRGAMVKWELENGKQIKE